MIIHGMNTVVSSQAGQAGQAAHGGVLNGVAFVPHLGVIRVQGADAASFLQGQLTQDFVLLKPHEARLAAFCSAKGRMQASFVGFKRSVGSQGESTESEILLICNRDILAATVKRLSMFVMRAKAKLTDASDSYSVYGLAGDAIKSIASYAHSAWATSQFGDISVVGLYPADGVARALWVAPLSQPAPSGPALASDVWCWGEVRSGIATIASPIVDAFVPQMLNYESVGGVSFKKGCYPGQEVVARSQFRGTLKRRAYLVHSETEMAVGQAIFSPADAEQACGTVAQAAASPLGGFDAMVSMQVAAAQAGGLTVGAPSGPRAELLALPYPLLDDI
jgi:folate-binding protein YgfZ